MAEDRINFLHETCTILIFNYLLFVKRYLHWTFIAPCISWAVYFFDHAPSQLWLQLVVAVLLISSVLSAVHHSEVIAHRVGEPFGTVVLAISITAIEVSLIITLMLGGGEQAKFLARDTVFSAVMLIMNGLLGACLLIGGIRHREQFFQRTSANTALVSLVAIIVLTFLLPNYTTSIEGPRYNTAQLAFVSVACLIIYGSFLLIQTVRHKEYFITPEESGDDNTKHHPSKADTMVSVLMLLVSLAIVVLMAKSLSPAITTGLENAGLPESLVGVVIAAVILLPEGIAAVKAARQNKLQTSINLTLGSALASIGLTIPAVALIAVLFDMDLVLGIDTKATALVVLSVFTVMLSLNRGKTNVLYGIVLIVNLLAYIFTIIFP